MTYPFFEPHDPQRKVVPVPADEWESYAYSDGAVIEIDRYGSNHVVIIGDREYVRAAS